MRNHPCHACPEREEHARWAERLHRLERDTVALRDKVANRTGSLARTFDLVCSLLSDRGYLADGEVTPAGRTLSRIWTETDLLVAECLRQGIWDGLAPAELAAAVSTVVYEARRETDDRVSLPRGPVEEAIAATLDIWAGLESAEAAHGLQLTRMPDLGFVWPIYRWARGESLAKVLASAPDAEMPAGDFVRWARQVVDLLGQIAEAVPTKPGTSAKDGTPAKDKAPTKDGKAAKAADAKATESVRAAALSAMAAVNRGVLAYNAIG